jgi:hypothetical protein
MSADTICELAGAYLDGFSKFQGGTPFNLYNSFEWDDELQPSAVSSNNYTTYFHTLALVLRFEHNFLDRFDPVVAARLSVGRERVVALRCAQLEPVFIKNVATRGVLQRDIAPWKVRVLTVSTERHGAGRNLLPYSRTSSTHRS